MNAKLLAITAGLALLTAPAAFQAAKAQPAVILGREEVKATVETVDLQKRMVLLRGPTGELVTIDAGPDVRNLPQLKPGDRVVIRYGEAVGARIVRPGDLAAESTITAETADIGARPAGTIISHERERVRVEGVNTANNTVAFIGADRVPRTITVQQPAMRDFLRTLKAGDEVDVTFTDIINLSVEPASR